MPREPVQRRRYEHDDGDSGSASRDYPQQRQSDPTARRPGYYANYWNGSDAFVDEEESGQQRRRLMPFAPDRTPTPPAPLTSQAVLAHTFDTNSCVIRGGDGLPQFAMPFMRSYKEYYSRQQQQQQQPRDDDVPPATAAAPAASPDGSAGVVSRVSADPHSHPQQRRVVRNAHDGPRNSYANVNRREHDIDDNYYIDDGDDGDHHGYARSPTIVVPQVQSQAPAQSVQPAQAHYHYHIHIGSVASVLLGVAAVAMCVVGVLIVAALLVRITSSSTQRGSNNSGGDGVVYLPRGTHHDAIFQS